ncbi:tetratricopeptide repeat protein [Actinomadura sp. WMMB 499]|uniref:tetratricopeptide repeat protein n=1 Tax=Actinomadura sp. WMMB 499 TaxID=1219491 RepID=UPI00159D307F|nr:tetratricopeptide repeat protein [Actinomadura sp. WMMB 499]
MTSALDRARVLLDLRRPADAEREVRAVLTEDPGHARARLYLARALSHQGDADGALDAVNDYLAARPDDWVGHAEAGSILAGAGRPRDAIGAYRRALERRPDAPFVHNRLAWTHYDLGEPGSARSHAEYGLALAPDDAELHAVLGLVLAGDGEHDRAREHAERALALAPERSAVHRAHGKVLLDTGRHRAAADAFREALRLDPGWTDGRGAVMRAELARNPLHRLHRFLWKPREWPRSRIGWCLATCVFPPWLAVMALATVLMWANWVNFTLTGLWIHRDPRRRDLMEPATLFKVAGAALAAGAAMLAAGALLRDGRTIVLGLAVLALVTPLMEPTALDTARGALFLLVPMALTGWVALLTALAYAAPAGWTTSAALVTCCAALASAWLSILLQKRT